MRDTMARSTRFAQPLRPLRFLPLLWVTLAAASCGSDDSPAENPGGDVDAGSDVAEATDAAASDSASGADSAAVDSEVAEASADVAADSLPLEAGAGCEEKAKSCAATFGTLFTKANGRADGTLVALVRPVDQQCAMANNDHAIVQLSILGQVQRLVVSVDGIAVMSKSAPLIGPDYVEGWHTGMNLDYPVDLGVHSTDFTAVSMDEAVGFLCDHLTVGAPVSVFAYCDGQYPASAHQIHYNDKYPDGAIVVDPTSANPTYLLFRYADQTF